MNTPPLFSALASSERILLSGAGGGFDIFCGLPLYFFLREQGKEVFLANLSFSGLGYVEGQRLAPAVVEVTAESSGSDTYFPERYLCEWLEVHDYPGSVHCFEHTGVVPMAMAYQALAEELKADALVLIDGGTDSLMRGDEVGLGTPHGDILSIAAACDPRVAVDTKLLACLGFGIDAFHGVCHAQFLEAVAAISKSGGYLGAFSILYDMPEVQRYIQATEYVFSKMPHHQSIVNASILSAIEGDYGDVHRTERTLGSQLWINPLMSMYWSFQLDAVAQRLLYLDAIKETETYEELSLQIANFRKSYQPIKEWESIPV